MVAYSGVCMQPTHEYQWRTYRRRVHTNAMVRFDAEPFKMNVAKKREKPSWKHLAKVVAERGFCMSIIFLFGMDARRALLE